LKCVCIEYFIALKLNWLDCKNATHNEILFILYLLFALFFFVVASIFDSFVYENLINWEKETIDFNSLSQQTSWETSIFIHCRLLNWYVGLFKVSLSKLFISWMTDGFFLGNGWIAGRLFVRLADCMTESIYH